MEAIKLQRNESTKEYITRICQNKELYGLTWKDIANQVALNTGMKRDESYYRKKYKNCPGDVNNNMNEVNTEMLSELILQLKKEQVKLADERAQNQAYVRKMAREETLKDMAIKAARAIGEKKALLKPTQHVFEKGERKAVLQLSDWHMGIEIDNYKNKYSPTITMDRLATLRDKVINLLVENKVDELWIADLGDLISGRIHLPLRIQSRMDVISQEILVSELLAELLSDLSQHCKIHYYSVIDNHSRVEPNKEASLQLETLARIHPWYLKQRLAGNKRIEIHQNKIDETVMTFNIYDWLFAGVHGDKDRPSKVVNNITNLSHTKFDIILTAHLHHFASEEDYDTVVVSNGSLMGVDDHAYDLRKFSAPTQNLIIVTPENPTKYIARILV